MRGFELAPLMRSTIGFDRMMELLDNALRFEPTDTYPPYDIEKAGEDAYRITMAVAGFTPEQISIVQEENQLVVTGRKQGDGESQYLYRGIPTPNFERRFSLAGFVKVTGASLNDGLLTIDLVRELPEEMKPRRIEIANGTARKKAIPHKSKEIAKAA